MKKLIIFLSILTFSFLSIAKEQYKAQTNPDGSIILIITDVDEESGETLSTNLQFFKDKDEFYEWQKVTVKTLEGNSKRIDDKAKEIDKIKL